MFTEISNGINAVAPGGQQPSNAFPVSFLPQPNNQILIPTNPDDSETYISRTLYICKLPHDFTEAEIHRICSPFGDLRKITCYPSRQIAFAEFWDIRDAQKARNELKEVYIGDRLIEIQYSKTKDDRDRDRNTNVILKGTLYVRPLTTERNFYDPNTLAQYKELFNRYGEVKKVNTNRKREAEKFVEYHDLRSAEAALEALNGADFNGVKLEVQFANQSSKTIASRNKDNFVQEFTIPPQPNSKERNGYRREEQGQAFLTSSKGNISNSNECTQPVTIDPTSWPFPAIKMKWLGSEGPSVVENNPETSKDSIASNSWSYSESNQAVEPTFYVSSQHSLHSIS